MKRNQWDQVYEPVPQALDQRLENTFSQLHEHEPEARVARRLPFRTAAIVMAIIVALGGVAYALLTSKTADIYGWFFGDTHKERLLAGDIALTEQSYTLGDVVYAIEEVIYENGTLYGTGIMKPKEGANIILMASDHYVWEPAGYVLHIGDEEVVPDNAPTYLELAEERDAKIIMPGCYIQGFVDEKGELSSSEYGSLILPNTDGTIRFTFEFQGYGGKVPQSDTYTIRLKSANWEVDKDNNHLREEPQNTFISEEWDVTVTPELKGESR